MSECCLWFSEDSSDSTGLLCLWKDVELCSALPQRKMEMDVEQYSVHHPDNNSAFNPSDNVLESYWFPEATSTACNEPYDDIMSCAEIATPDSHQNSFGKYDTAGVFIDEYLKKRIVST